MEFSENVLASDLKAQQSTYLIMQANRASALAEILESENTSVENEVNTQTYGEPSLADCASAFHQDDDEGAETVEYYELASCEQMASARLSIA